MKLTIAIPTLNRKSYLRQTLESVLTQTATDYEIVVSDNVSEDGTMEMLHEYRDPRIRIFAPPRRLAMAPHWNFCLSKAEGDWFILLSDDDLLLPPALERLLEPLTSGRAVMSYSPFFTIDGEGVPMMKSVAGPELSSGPRFIAEHLGRRIDVMPSGVMAATERIRHSGGFPDIGTVSDLGLRLLLASGGEVACLSEPLLCYRVHGSNLSGKMGTVVASHLELCHWALGRKELEPYMNLIQAFVGRGITGYGFRSALGGDEAGVDACRKAIRELGLPFRRDLLARGLFWSGKRGLVRLLMGKRDDAMSWLRRAGGF